MQRHVVCYRIPAFQVALARLEDSSLRDTPIAITPSVNPQTVLLETSHEAQQEGAYAGMQVGHAKRVCPALKLLPPDPPTIRKATDTIDQVVSRFAPVWESANPGHVFLDLTGTARLFGRACDIATKIEAEIAERFNLIGVAGVASNKLVSEVASTVVAPLQLYDVRPGAEQMFLSPLPISTLPLRTTQSTFIYSLFADLNINTLGQLSMFELADLEAVLGSLAVQVCAWARGIDDTPVLPPTKQPCVEATRKLEEDEVDVERLRGFLDGTLESLCCELRKQQKVCQLLTLRLQYRDEREVTGNERVLPGSYWEGELAVTLHRLLQRCFQRRVRVRAFTVTLAELQPAIQQLSLVEVCTAFMPSKHSAANHLARSKKLSVAIDTIRAKFGHQSIQFGFSS